MYQPGFAYQKAGVMFSEIQLRTLRQGDLFTNEAQREHRARLMGALDAINNKWGRGAVRVAAEGLVKPWQMKRGRMSPGYTTDWSGLPLVLAK